ncbi:MAG TPA: CU044_5270 family protein [Pseudonocardiaceae bacterium]|jgi:hypothetical protein|nr:CU044_5270 family protein [Pseudonocardiaceae bacterium]
MNDLHLLGELLAADEPSRAVIDRSRHRLRNRMRGGSIRRHRTGRLVGATGLTAAAVTAVVVITSMPTAPTAPTGSTGSTAPSRSTGGATAADAAGSGRRVLLAAATAAANSPDSSGAYWYVKITETDGPGAAPFVTEYWTRPDGEWWFRGDKTGGRVVRMKVYRTAPFSLVAVDLTLDRLRELPTEPTALKAWIAEAETHGTARTSAGPLTASDRDKATFWSLLSLVSTLPAPPKVRAAAFRAIASYPDVRSLGAVPGGQGLSLPPDGNRLVIDPAMGRVDETAIYVTTDGGLYTIPTPGSATVQAGWTNSLPGQQ